MPISNTVAAHLLRRAGFGGTTSEVNAIQALDLPSAVDRVLDTSLNPPSVEPPELSNENRDEWQRWVACTAAWLDRMRSVPTPIQEKMALFWHGHFCSSQDKVFYMRHLWQQNELFRVRGMGDFETLVQQMAIGPAMLVYLDNALNVAGAQQENFARESMELFTLGVNQYTQDDVVAAARAWTGHGLLDDGSRYKFHKSLHDGGSKTFMGKTRKWDGPGVVHEILTGPSRPIAARFIATKLWSFFAYPNPAAELVDALTTAFLDSNLDIKTLLRTLFLRSEFYSEQSRGGLVRSPIEFVVAAMRYTHVNPGVAHPEWWLDAMGQAPFYPPDVSGWKQNGYWVSSSAYWARAGFARYLTWKAVEAGILHNVENATVQKAVDLAFDTFGIDAPSAQTRTALETWLTAERAASGWAQQANLITLTLLSPDFNLA